MPRYRVYYTVNVRGAREVDARSSRDAERKVRRAEIEELDLDSIRDDEPAVYEIDPDDDLEPEDEPTPARRTRSHLAVIR